MADIFNFEWRAYIVKKEIFQYNCNTTAFERSTHDILTTSISLYQHSNNNYKDFEKMFQEALKFRAISTANTNPTATTQEIVAYNKRDRHDLNPKQNYVLEMEYQVNPYPKPHRIRWLALYLGLEEAHVYYWFTGRLQGEILLSNYTRTMQTLTLPKCHVPLAICDIPRTSEAPKLKSKKDILVELLVLDEMYSKEIIEQTNDLSFDQDINLSFLDTQGEAAHIDVDTNHIIDINFLRPTLCVDVNSLKHTPDVSYSKSSSSPEHCALTNLEDGRNCWNQSRRC
uniref:Homeobox protein cut-like 1 n=1 Tax=Zeugodacus cucurbitae TaxID=28588 RepID=A0A0A1XDE3_ZEUCU